jgi:hypothetical protein
MKSPIQYLQSINQKNSIVKDVSLNINHFKNFTNDNLYKRIFSFIKRFDEGSTTMPL